MPTLELIRGLVARNPAQIAERPLELRFEAAVAMVLNDSPRAGPQLLFIERAEREGDPWSGQMAFPGGRREMGDRNLERTASRETLEEVGLELGPSIGRLDEFSGRRAASALPIVVAPFVYEVKGAPPALTLNHEVKSTVWVPLRWMLDPASAASYEFERANLGGPFPSIRYQGYTIWGMTYRILQSFFDLLDRELPVPGGL